MISYPRRSSGQGTGVCRPMLFYASLAATARGNVERHILVPLGMYLARTSITLSVLWRVRHAHPTKSGCSQHISSLTQNI